MEKWPDMLLAPPHLVLAQLNSHLEASCKHTRSFQQMLISFSIH